MTQISGDGSSGSVLSTVEFNKVMCSETAVVEASMRHIVALEETDATLQAGCRMADGSAQVEDEE